MEEERIKKNITSIFVGKKNIKERLITAIFPSMALSFLLFLFGPLDLSYTAESFVNYTVFDIFPVCLLIFVIIFFVLFLVSWLPGGKLHAWICSLYTGLVIAFYVQGNFLNIDLGVLDGTMINWQDYGDNALLNLFVFSMIFVIPFLLHYISRKLWKRFVVFSSILMMIMHIVPLVILFVHQESKIENYYLETDGEYVLGDENIIVFILDSTSQRAMNNMLGAYPDALAPFHDFTFFDNYNTEVFGTFPCMTTLLTHQAYDYNIPYMDWFYNSWHSDDAQTFYKEMKKQGWTARLYNNTKESAGRYENEYGLIDNIKKITNKEPVKINKSAFRKLIKLSFYRYFPLIMKAPFWIYTGDLNNMVSRSSVRAEWDNFQTIQKLLSDGISVGDEEKSFIVYHYQGAHPLYQLDKNGKLSSTSTDESTQLAGYFYAISQYLEHMKSLHIYDNSSIIITADHGDINYPQSILFIKPPYQRQENINVSHAPLTQFEFLPTIAKLAGVEIENFGPTFFEIPENEEVLRCLGISYKNKELPREKTKNHNAIKQYCYTGDSDTLHEMMINGDYEVIHTPYSYY